MDFKEFSKIAIELKAAYPNHKILPDDAAAMFWYKMIKDIDYSVCENAVIEIVQTSVFPPSLAEIRAKCSEILHGRIKSPNEAWQEVLAACRSYGHTQYKEALESFDDITREAAKKVGYCHICRTTDQFTNERDFKSIYKELADKKDLENRMSLEVKNNRDLIGGGKAAIEKKGD